MFAALNDFHESSMTVFTPAERAAADECEARAAALRHAARQRLPDWRDRMAAWEASVRESMPEWRVMTPTDIPFEGQKFRVLEDGSVLSESYAPTKMDNRFRLTTDVRGITAVRVEALTHPQLPRRGPGRATDGTGVLTEFALETSPVDDEWNLTTAAWRSAHADVSPEPAPLSAPYLERDAAKDQRTTGPVAYAVDGDLNTGWTTDVDPARRNVDHAAVFVAETPVSLEGEGEYLLSFRMTMKHGGWNSDDNQSNILGRYRFSVTTDPVDALPPALTRPQREALAKPPAERSPAEADLLFDRWLRDAEPAEAARLNAVWAAYPEGTSQLVVEALDTPRPTAVMLRGDFLSPGEPVAPGVPEVLGALPDTDEPARLRLARWLADEDTPTTARVAVNRLWQAYFGRGLVETPEDFGMQSPPPSHPRLLDWLARELIDSGWSLKHVHRLILDSATYRQSSRVEPETLAADPYNVWLSRGPRLRVDAEAVRDGALAAAGLLDLTVGGPSVYPPAPEFLFRPPASYGPKTWAETDGAKRYRRSLYVHRFRSVLYPPLEAFDAPKADAACVRRERSNTPLQALVLLNERQFVEAAAAMGERVRRQAAAEADRIDLAHRLATSRVPTEREANVLADFLAAERAAGADETEAWAALCRVLLNLDETITKG